MKRTWTIIGVGDVPGSFKWYQALFGQPATLPAHDHFGQILDSDGTVLLCLHEWGTHEHPSLISPRSRAAWQRPPLVFPVLMISTWRCRGHALSLLGSRRSAAHEPKYWNYGVLAPRPDGYYVTISARSAA